MKIFSLSQYCLFLIALLTLGACESSNENQSGTSASNPAIGPNDNNSCFNGSIQDQSDNDQDGIVDSCDLDDDNDGIDDLIEIEKGSNPFVKGSIPELDDGLDNDGDGQIDEGFDSDSDGFTPFGGDCNDLRSDIYPFAIELIDGVDNNCNGTKDADADKDEIVNFIYSQLCTVDTCEWIFDKSLPACEQQGVICQEGKLTELRLNNKNLNGLFPKEIFYLLDLEVLDLGLNRIFGEIPTEIKNVSNLKILNLESFPRKPVLQYFARDRLSGIIPNEIGDLTLLEALILSHNEIMGEIPDAIGNLTNLKKLSLQNNQFSGPIPNFFSTLPSLNELYLSFNRWDCPVIDYSTWAFENDFELFQCNDQTLEISSNLPIDAIRFRTSIDGRDNGTTAVVINIFRIDENTSGDLIHLSRNESLKATLYGETKDLLRYENQYGIVSYRALFTDNIGSVDATISYQQSSGNEYSVQARTIPYREVNISITNDFIQLGFSDDSFIYLGSNGIECEAYTSTSFFDDYFGNTILANRTNWNFENNVYTKSIADLFSEQTLQDISTRDNCYFIYRIESNLPIIINNIPSLFIPSPQDLFQVYVKQKHYNEF